MTPLEVLMHKKMSETTVRYNMQVLKQYPQNKWFYPVLEGYDVLRHLCEENLVCSMRIPDRNGTIFGISHYFLWNERMEYNFKNLP